MSSVGADVAAQLSRGTRNEVSQDYAVILPPLPTGYVVQNIVFLHADIKGRPYRAEDFREPLFQRVPPTEVLALGAYQMNHVWAVTCKTAEGAKKFLGDPELTVKGRRCIVIDPSHHDVRLKLHWLLYHVREEDVRNALSPYGTVMEIGLDKWRIDGYSQQSTMTRTVVVRLKADVTLDDLPHQLPVGGELALVVVPGRAPRCLRCQQIGHIRKDCRVPRCNVCKRFGHTVENCSRTYAAAAMTTVSTKKSELTMDEAEAEECVSPAAISGAQETSTQENEPPKTEESLKITAHVQIPIQAKTKSTDSNVTEDATNKTSANTEAAEVHQSLPKRISWIAVKHKKIVRW
ncbi:uncharacterized protein LOC119449206 [Dermacentor silvarum]|uniref:uncharacterized protein LOC119449206 n=1 Tax=Dermacentor silvarum TaxID=543639 RepID=UPI002101C685|nr:uncharacterized protein LOC119449206 [Dermacentor silvarum]